MIEKKYKRNLVERIRPHLHTSDALVIYGARQVGKSTLMEYLMENDLPKGNTFYMDLEQTDLLEICNSGPEGVERYLLEKGADPSSRIFLLIDEIQYMIDPSKFIKLLHDHHRKIKLIASGSSALGMKQKFAQSLAGRSMEFVLHPLSFDEFLLFKGKKYVLLPENSESINAELVPLAEEFIRFGGFPRIVLSKDRKMKKELLWQYVNAYVRKDVRDAGRISDIDAFNRVVFALAAQSGSLLNVSRLASDVGISQTTLKSYLNLLEGTFVARRMPPFGRSARGEIGKSPKWYLLDTGMMHLLWLKDFPEIIHGSSFETFVYLELAKAGFSPRFWRTSDGREEVDFVVEGKRLHALEAKVSYSKEGGRALAAFARRYPASTRQVCLYGREKVFEHPWETVKRLEVEMKDG
ncbi:MAG: ATP-binding protein [Candidatus Micrarchaeota archaeon]